MKARTRLAVGALAAAAFVAPLAASVAPAGAAAAKTGNYTFSASVGGASVTGTIAANFTAGTYNITGNLSKAVGAAPKGTYTVNFAGSSVVVTAPGGASQTFTGVSSSLTKQLAGLASDSQATINSQISSFLGALI